MSKEQIEKMANDIEVISCNGHIDFYRTAEILYTAGYVKHQASEVAREIFAEIERLLSMHFCSCLPKGATEHYDYYEGDLADAIAELKKKYTEGKE